SSPWHPAHRDSKTWRPSAGPAFADSVCRTESRAASWAGTPRAIPQSAAAKAILPTTRGLNMREFVTSFGFIPAETNFQRELYRINLGCPAGVKDKEVLQCAKFSFRANRHDCNATRRVFSCRRPICGLACHLFGW